MADPISSGIKRPGALTAKAKSAGMTIDAYAAAHKGDKGLTGEQARYYLNVLKPANTGRSSGGSNMAKAAAGK